MECCSHAEIVYAFHSIEKIIVLYTNAFFEESIIVYSSILWTTLHAQKHVWKIWMLHISYVFVLINSIPATVPVITT